MKFLLVTDLQVIYPYWTKKLLEVDRRFIASENFTVYIGDLPITATKYLLEADWPSMCNRYQ